MGRSVNRVILVGNAGSDPDVRKTGSGTTVAHLSLATDRVTRRDGVERRITDWHRLTFWAGAAEAVERWVRRGSRLYVEGRIEYGSYDRDGVTIPTSEVVVHDFVFLDGRSQTGAEEDQERAEASPLLE